MFLREMCKKILFYPTKSGHNLPYRGEVRHERKLTWGRRVPKAADKIAFYRVKVFLFELF